MQRDDSDANTRSSDGASVRWGRLAVCVAVGALLWVLPAPDGLPAGGWRVLAVFLGVICGFLLRPLDMAPVVLLGLSTLILSRTLELKPTLANGFGDSTVWLVVLAFLIADAVEGSGLGRRIALLLLRAIGRSITGIAYAIAMTELLLAPFIPSNTARGGGIMAPIVFGLARTLGSSPANPERGGAYLVQVGTHANLVTSAMFLTAMAGNVRIPIAAREALGIDFNYATWIQGSVVPGLAALALVPLVVRFLERPSAIDVSRARASVAEQLARLGSPTRHERRLAALLLTLFVFWSLHGIAPEASSVGWIPTRAALPETTMVALAGVLGIVLLGIRSWRDVVGAARAWDALIWMGGFVALANALKTEGVTEWFLAVMKGYVQGGDPILIVIALALVYYLSMYFFSQLTAHIFALAGTFFLIGRSADVPPFLLVGIIAYFSCLCGATTPWSTGPAIIYFGPRYVSVGRWMRNGAGVGVFHWALWLTLGMAWWKAIGWW